MNSIVKNKNPGFYSCRDSFYFLIKPIAFYRAAVYHFEEAVHWLSPCWRFQEKAD
jgi:hypothetical protein